MDVDEALAASENEKPTNGTKGNLNGKSDKKKRKAEDDAVEDDTNEAPTKRKKKAKVSAKNAATENTWNRHLRIGIS